MENQNTPIDINPPIQGQDVQVPTTSLTDVPAENTLVSAPKKNPRNPYKLYAVVVGVLAYLASIFVPLLFGGNTSFFVPIALLSIFITLIFFHKGWKYHLQLGLKPSSYVGSIILQLLLILIIGFGSCVFIFVTFIKF